MTKQLSLRRQNQPKHEQRTNRFCSSSCSATFNNKGRICIKKKTTCYEACSKHVATLQKILVALANQKENYY
jgi:hypothetical protein